MNKVIRNDTDYDETLAALEKIMDRNPDVGTPESDQLEVLALLIADYESRKYQFLPPNPIEAIKFRMEQQNLMPRDLIPYMGSRSRVSEVLSGKRRLTLAMIRSLHAGLAIPANVLIQGLEQADEEETEIDWDRFPIKQMIAWGWIKDTNLSWKEQLRSFFDNSNDSQVQAILYRTSKHVRSTRVIDEYSLMAWSTQILFKAKANPTSVKYKSDNLTIERMRKIVRLSASDNGPLLARDFLREIGIQLIVERQLPRIYLDGAAIIPNKLNPVIGLTLRYDRIDNFWFSLLHELAHLALHLDENKDAFYDDLDTEDDMDSLEREADNLAGEALIPLEAWKRSAASRLRSPEAAEHLAKQLGIHPAIVAGRMRHEFKAYRLLNNLVGHREVRTLFAEVNWE